jgi:hypothetical protein
MTIMNGDVGAHRVKLSGNLCADPPRRAGHQRDAAFETVWVAHVTTIILARRQFFAGHVIKATF